MNQKYTSCADKPNRRAVLLMPRYRFKYFSRFDNSIRYPTDTSRTYYRVAVKIYSYASTAIVPRLTFCKKEAKSFNSLPAPSIRVGLSATA
jgi:hypothetical protein